MKNLPKIRNEDIVIQELVDEILIYDLKTSKAFCLNETSKLIWENCNGTTSITEITTKLSQHFQKQVSEDIVYLAIKQFADDSLLENDADLSLNRFAGMSRREVIRKVGYASMIALPIISSVVVPQAIDAQSVAPACTGTCFAAGQNLCASSNSNDPVTVYSSTDGSCTGSITGFTVTICNATDSRTFNTDSCVV